MKRIILPWVAGAFALIVTATGAHAQLQKDSGTYAKNEKQKDESANYRGAVDASNSSTAFKNVSKRALKEFAHTYKNAEAIHWYQDKDGFIAYCTINGIKNRSNYDRKGNWLYSMQNYDEKKMPKDVRARVKRVYYDFNITGVQEIHVGDKTVYLVHMHDDTVYQTVRVTEEDMDIFAPLK